MWTLNLALNASTMHATEKNLMRKKPEKMLINLSVLFDTAECRLIKMKTLVVQLSMIQSSSRASYFTFYLNSANVGN